MTSAHLAANIRTTRAPTNRSRVPLAKRWISGTSFFVGSLNVPLLRLSASACADEWFACIDAYRPRTEPCKGGVQYVLTYIPRDWYVCSMPSPTKLDPDVATPYRLLEAARDVIRTKGFTATTVSDLCDTAGVTSGAFFHNFKSKEALGAAAAEYWATTTPEFLRRAVPRPQGSPRSGTRLYRFSLRNHRRRTCRFTCLVGTMAQEVYSTSPPKFAMPVPPASSDMPLPSNQISRRQCPWRRSRGVDAG